MIKGPDEALRVRARSVIPGRQRWDVGPVLNRPRVAQYIEVRLRESPGFEFVRANPLTGRVLVVHEAALSSERVGQLVRDVATEVVRTEKTLLAPGPAHNPAQKRGQQDRTTGSLASLGGGAAALVLGGLLVHSPMVRLAAVLAAAVVVIRGGWRRMGRAEQASEGSDRSLRHPMRQLIGSHQRQFYEATALSILGQALLMAPALFMGWMFAVLTKGSSVSLVRLGLATASSQLWFLAGVTALVMVGFAGVSFISGVMWRELAQTVQFEWRTEMFAHVQRAELRHLEGERTTRLAEVLTDDIDQFARFLARSADTLVQIGSCFLFFIPVFLICAPSIAWIAFLPVPIIAWLSFFYQERVAPGHAASSETGSLLNSQLINSLEASATVKSFGAEEYEIDRIRQLSETYRQSNRRIDLRTTAYNQAVLGVAVTSFVGILLSGGLEVISGTLPFEVYNGLINLPMLLFMKLPALGDAVEQYHRTVAALGRVIDLRRLPVESGGTGRPLDVDNVTGEMVLEGVTFAYPGRSPVLQDLSLRLAARKTTGIVGVTGAGKTTIAKLLLRFQDVESGRVVLDGSDVRELRLRDLRHAVGFVSQDAFLFDGTIGENISYGTFDADPERIATAARLAEADGFIEDLPSQYDTMIGERGVTLSGGQKQRLSLARAIVKSAPILILDEATSAVDNETEAAIQHALADFARDRTMVIIAHRLSTIRHADWIYVMGNGGTVAEEGTHCTLLERDGVYASLWRLQVGEAS